MPLWKRRQDPADHWRGVLAGKAWLLYLVGPAVVGQTSDAAGIECGTLDFGEDGGFGYYTTTITPEGTGGADIELARGHFDVRQSEEFNTVALVLSEFRQSGKPIPEPGEFAEASDEVRALTGQPSTFMPLPTSLLVLTSKSDNRRLVTVEPRGDHRYFVLHRR